MIVNYHRAFIAKFESKKDSINKRYNEYIKHIDRLQREISLLTDDLAEEDDPHEIIRIKQKIIKLQNEIDTVHKEMTLEEYNNYKFIFTPLVILYDYSDDDKDKREIMRSYMLSHDPEIYFNKVKNIQDICKYCDSTNLKTIMKGVYYCENCLSITEIISEQILISSINPHSTTKNNNYHKSSYFRLRLNIVRMLIKPKNVDEIIEQIQNYIMTYNITGNENSVSYKTVYDILKVLGLSKYYQYIPYFMFVINKDVIKKPITGEDADNMADTFAKIELVWRQKNQHMKVKKSFPLKYNFCLKKILEIHKHYEYVKYVDMYNSPTCKDKNNKIWNELYDEIQFF